MKTHFLYVEIKCQLLQILLLAQHASGTTMPIIRSSRVLHSGCCQWYLVLWFSSCWSVVKVKVMCPVCRMLLCPSSGAQDYYTVVAACGISCCGFQVAGLLWSWGLCVRFAGCCILCSVTIFLPKDGAVYGIMWKKQCRADNVIWRMRIACWISNATYTHSENVIHIVFPH